MANEWRKQECRDVGYPPSSSLKSWLRAYREFSANAADVVAVAVAVSLPLSTTATIIFIIWWLLALLPTIDLGDLRRVILTLPGGLPVALVMLAAVGMLWADVGWSERVAGLRPLLKLLVIPLLLVQFRRSERGLWIVYGLVAGCTLLLVASFVEIFLAIAFIPGKPPGIVVKDYISQSGFFVVCIFLLLEKVEQDFRSRNFCRVAIEIVLIVAFLVNIGFVAVSRTSLVVIPVLLLLFGLRRSWKVALAACVIWCMLFAAAWTSSPYLKQRLVSAASIRADDQSLEAVSNRQRMELWTASIDLLARAPLLGHGTGTIRNMFKCYKANGPDSEINRRASPHNQTLAVALQLGIAGSLLLFLMWSAHGLLFRGCYGIAGWFGLVIVTQNVVSSLFNAHLSDFTQGWTYVICVGVAAGMVQRLREAGQ